MRRMFVAMACICLVASPAQAARKAKAKVKAAKFQQEQTSPPSIELKRLGLLPPSPTKGVSKKVLQQAMKIAETELSGSGFQVVPPAKLVSANAKRGVKVAGTCTDTPACMAEAGRNVGAGYVANLTLTPAGKQFTARLQVLETDEGKVVSNIVSFIPKAQAKPLGEAIKKQVPRAVVALNKHLDARQTALAAAAQKPEEPRAVSAPVAVATVKPEPVAVAQAPVSPAPPARAEPAAAQPEVRTVSALPPLVEPAPVARATPAEAPLAMVSEAPSSGPGVLPYAMIGVGAVGVGLGVGYFGTQATAASKDFQAGRDPIAARDRAKSQALLSDVSTVAGAALMAVGGGILIFSGDSGSTSSGSIAVAPTAGGMAVSGSF